MNKFNELFLKKIEAGLMIDAMEMVNDGFRKAQHGMVPKLMQDSFVKQPRDAEQHKIDEEVKKFEEMIEAGGLDTAMGIINQGFRDAARAEKVQKA